MSNITRALEDFVENVGGIEIAALIETLPHGSGIDCDWDLGDQDAGGFELINEYHVMEDGMYAGYVPFVADFNWDCKLIDVTAEDCEDEGLEDYLFDRIAIL